MNLILNEAQDLVLKLKDYQSKNKNVDVAVCPPFVYIAQIANLLKESSIAVGAQNMFYKEEGAFTGEVSPTMLKDIGIKLVIIGHSERRQIFKENNNEINLKIKAALKHNLIPIFCVGEDLETRESGNAEKWVTNQLISGLKDIKNEIEKIIIAYEPIWAIGTGKICAGKDALKIIQTIREMVKDLSTSETSKKIRILYGGSIKSDNFEEHIRNEDIDGGLVGGSSLKFEEFTKIIELAEKASHIFF